MDEEGPRQEFQDVRDKQRPPLSVFGRVMRTIPAKRWAASRLFVAALGVALLLMALGVVVGVRGIGHSVPVPPTIGSSAATPAEAVEKYLRNLTEGRFAEAVALTRHRDGTPIVGREALTDEWLYESFFATGGQVHLESVHVGVGGALQKLHASDPDGVTLGLQLAGTSQACFVFRPESSIAAQALQVSGRWYITAAPGFPLFAAGPCQAGWRQYAQNPLILQAANEVTFFLTLPGYLPGRRSIADVQVSSASLPRATGIASCRSYLVQVRYVSKGETVLTFEESNGLLPVPTGIPSRKIEVVGVTYTPFPNQKPLVMNGQVVPEHPIGIAYTAESNGPRVTNAFWFQTLDGVQIRLLSTRFTSDELAVAAALMEGVPPSSYPHALCGTPGYVFPGS